MKEKPTQYRLRTPPVPTTQTTGTNNPYFANAERTANNYRHGKIVLINGIKLTSLMLSYGISVQKRREFSLYDIDDDFFEDDLA